MVSDCGKLIGLFLFCLLVFLLSILSLKHNVVHETFSRTELARPVMGLSWIVYRNNTKKLYAKMLKRSADYNFCLEFLILPSSGRFKPTCDKLTELERLKNRGKKG